MKILSSTLAASAAAAVALFLHLDAAHAFPSGAGGDCPANVAAVGSPHLNTQLTIITGTLEEGGFVFNLTGLSLAEGAVLDVPNGETPDHVVELAPSEAASADGTIFRGFLIRAQSLLDTGNSGGSDPGIIVDVGEQSQNAAVCVEPAFGITHTSNDDKVLASGTVRTAIADLTVVFDVTVVVSQRDGISEYYYSQYTVNFVSADASSPVAAPSATAPSDASPVVVSPTAAPVAADVSPPTTTPPVVDEDEVETTTDSPSGAYGDEDEDDPPVGSPC